MRVLVRSMCVAAISLLAVSDISAQACGGAGQAGFTVAIDAQTKRAVVDSVFRVVREKYVFPDRTGDIVKYIDDKLRSGSYDDIFKADDFAQALTGDLRAVSDDLHFGVSIQPHSSGLPVSPSAATCTSPESISKSNFGFKTVRLLAGNIGYLEMTMFADTAEGRPTAEAAMQLLSGVDALIFDLRSSPGGYSSMVQLLAGYLFEPNTELHTLYSGAQGESQQIRTIRPTHGKPRLDLPVYILTSPATASAAEAFAYDLKHLGRATVVGERTSGAGYCAELVNIEFPRFTLEFQLPVYLPVHPVTHSNWQENGVEPDVSVQARDALAEAHQRALLDLAHKVSDSRERWAFEWAGMAIKTEYRGMELAADKLAEYTGNYGPRRILLKDSDLMYERDGNPSAFRLVPIDTDLFALEGSDRMRLRFDRDAAGVITGVTGLYDLGHQDSHLKQR